MHRYIFPGTTLMTEKENFEIEGRFWVMHNGSVFLGEGRCSLLERIHNLGSIKKAAAEMDMSYRKAWRLLASMNRQSPSPLVEVTIGGASGGGTRLTPYCLSMIKEYRRMNLLIKKEFKNFTFRVPQQVEQPAL